MTATMWYTSILLGYSATLPFAHETSGSVSVLSEERRVEGDGHPLQPNGDDDGATPSSSHRPP